MNTFEFTTPHKAVLVLIKGNTKRYLFIENENRVYEFLYDAGDVSMHLYVYHSNVDKYVYKESYNYKNAISIQLGSIKRNQMHLGNFLE